MVAALVEWEGGTWDEEGPGGPPVTVVDVMLAVVIVAAPVSAVVLESVPGVVTIAVL